MHLLHVVRPIGRPDATGDALRARLARLAPGSAEDRGVVTAAEVPHAKEVAEGICHVAERIGADLVCMPSRDRIRSFSAVEPGSTARAVVARSACPIVLTPTGGPE